MFLEPAVIMVIRVIPIDLLAFEWKRIFDESGHGGLTWLKEQEDRGRWTARLIGDLSAWVGRTHG